MTPLEILALASRTSDPLNTLVRLACAEPNAQLRRQLLQEGLARFGRVCDEQAAREIRLLGEMLWEHDSAGARRLLDETPAGSSPAADWLRAAVLECDTRFIEAFECLESLSPSGGDLDGFRILQQVRLLLRAGQPATAGQRLAQLAKETNSYRTLASAAKFLDRVRPVDDYFKRTCRIALLGNVTFDLLIPILKLRCFAEGIDLEVFKGAFDQYRQEILDPGSPLEPFDPDVVIIAADWHSLNLPAISENPDEVRARVQEARHLWAACRDRWGAFVIQHNFEIPPSDPFGRLSEALPGGRARMIRELDLELSLAAASESGVAVLDIEQIAGIHGKQTWTDPVLWAVSKQYPAPAALPLLARHQAALVRAILGLSRKCVILDLDGVLWGGVIGEDGLEGIELGGTPAGEAYVEFQRNLKALQERGIILAVCSKNNESDARLPFQSHPEMVLGLQDFAVLVANWLPKDENIRRIASQLNIGLDSIVFVDDSPVERARVRQRLPEVEVLDLPLDPALYSRALNQSLQFEALSLTDEDRRRTVSYRENILRADFAARAESIEDFIASLKMRVILRPFDKPNLPRIVQLINKTNQFNLTTRRMSEAEVSGMLAESGYYTQALRLTDRFGEAGLVGVLIGVIEEDSMRIHNWLLSCRVLGRKVEDVMLASALNYAAQKRLSYVVGEYLPTGKNELVRDLFEQFGFTRTNESPMGVRTYRLTLSEHDLQSPSFFELDDGTQIG